MVSALSAKHFHDEGAAYAYVEARIWPAGPVCPHCGGVERIGKMGGKSTRVGAYKCYQCRKPFTVKIGTIFEASHVAMHLWLQAMYLIAGSKKGVSSNQLHRILGVTLKTAWFMSHRIREAMRSSDFAPFGSDGSDGGMVEVDETYISRKAGKEVKKAGANHKMKVRRTPTPLKAISAFSNAACGVSTNIVGRSICTAMSLSSISDMTSALQTASMMPIAPTRCYLGWSASA